MTSPLAYGWPTNVTGTPNDRSLGLRGKATKVTVPDPAQGNRSEVGMATVPYRWNVTDPVETTGDGGGAPKKAPIDVPLEPVLPNVPTMASGCLTASDCLAIG